MLKNFRIIFILITFVLVILAFLRIVFATNATEKHVFDILLKKNKIIFFGDSVLNADHINKKKPSSLVKEFENIISIKNLEISGTAYNLYIIEKYFKLIKKHSKDTSLIIIPLNLRSFSTSWHGVPEYQFDRECSYLSIISLEPNFHCIREHLNNLIDKDRLLNKQEDFLNSPILAKGFLKTTKNNFFFNTGCEVSINGNNRNLNCKQKESFDQALEYMQHGLTWKLAVQTMRYNYHYAESITLDNIVYKSFLNIIEYAKLNDLKILFYITPLNVTSINQLSGKPLLEIINNNIKILQNYEDKKNIFILNLLDILDQKHFEEKCACEHIDLDGKKQLVKELFVYIDTKIGNI